MMRNKILGITLSFLLVATLLVGCGKSPETPTDAKASQTQQTAGKEESSVNLQPEEQEKPQEENQSQTESSTFAQTTSEETEKETVTGNTSSENSVHALPPEYIPPSFTSMEGFHSWLQTGGIEEEKRSELLSSAKNSSTVSLTSYYRPKMNNGKSGLVLTKIDAYSSDLHYYYTLATNKEKRLLRVDIPIAKYSLNNVTEKMQKCYNQINLPDDRVYDKYGSSTANQITYYYYHYPANDSTTVYWQVDENTFQAKYYGDYSQINEILPLLELEQVEYKVTNNPVVK